MRLIDADNALELFREEYQNTESLIKQGEKQLDSLAEGYTEAATVVRCRDCIEFEEIGKHPTNKGGTPFGHCYHWQYEQGMSPNEVDGNDFCSYGERKVDENGRTERLHPTCQLEFKRLPGCYRRCRSTGDYKNWYPGESGRTSESSEI